MNINPFNTIPKENMDKFHEKVLYLVENSGIQIKHEKILDRLSGFDGVTIKKDIATFSTDLVNKYVFNMEFDLPPYYNKDNLLMITGNMNPTIKDAATGKPRYATSEDLIKITKLEDSLGVTGTASVKPSDIPKHLQEIYMHKTVWENSRYKGNDIFEHISRSIPLGSIMILSLLTPSVIKASLTNSDNTTNDRNLSLFVIRINLSS